MTTTSSQGEHEASAFGTLRYAEDYRIAASRVIGNEKPIESPLQMPAYHLLAQSIELALKAYLRTTGMSARDLQAHSIRHNLTRLRDEAIARGLNEIVSLDDFDCHVIGTLSGAHQAHEFRYIKLGYKSLPFFGEGEAVASKLTKGLHFHCLSMKDGIGPEKAREIIDRRGLFGS